MMVHLLGLEAQSGLLTEKNLEKEEDIPGIPSNETLDTVKDLPSFLDPSKESILKKEIKKKESDAPMSGTTLTERKMLRERAPLHYAGIPAKVIRAVTKRIKEGKTAVKVVQSLDDALVAAYQYNVALEQKRIALREHVEKVFQANAQWRPDIKLRGTQQAGKTRSSFMQNREQYPGLTTKPLAGYTSKGTTRSNQANFNLMASQNIYAGGGTIASQGEALEKFRAQIYDLAVLEQDVLMNVVSAFISVVMHEALLKADRTYEGYLLRVLKETQAHYEIGDQRKADVDMAKARLSSASIQVKTMMMQLQASRASLQAMVGTPLCPTLTMPEYYQNMPSKLETLTHLALKYNPNLKAGCYIQRASRYGASKAVSNFLPNLDLSASAGPALFWEKNKESPNYLSNRKRTRSQNVSIDLTLTVPLYNRGLQQSYYREAENKIKESRLDIEGRRRTLIELCMSRFAAYEASKQNVASAKVSLDANKDALESGRTEYTLGSISLVEVLRFYEYWLEGERQYIRNTAELVKSSYQLAQMMGKLTASELKLDVDLHDPCRYYDDYHQAWFSVGEDGNCTPLFSSQNPDDASEKKP
jgi:outer membrane protein